MVHYSESGQQLVQLFGGGDYCEGGGVAGCMYVSIYSGRWCGDEDEDDDEDGDDDEEDDDEEEVDSYNGITYGTATYG